MIGFVLLSKKMEGVYVGGRGELMSVLFRKYSKLVDLELAQSIFIFFSCYKRQCVKSILSTLSDVCNTDEIYNCRK